ncbi:MAG: signal peptidase I [Candidatus Kerfeldbacteria bacterium]|nr:signal peptidase I [Candidatus Kerfeldbacteria bacterium]
MDKRKSSEEVPSNPIGDPKAWRGYNASLKDLARPQKKSEYLPSFSFSFGNFVLEVVKILIIAILIIKPIHYFILQPFYVKGASMEPNFHNNEYLIIDELSYRLHQPRRGDVVVLRDPFRSDEFFIKRIVGLPGERVVVDNNHVEIFNAAQPHGAVLDESAYLAPSVETSGHLDVTLGQGQYYMLGDNRPASFDSRSFGPITRQSMIGRTAVRAWPIPRARTFQTPTVPYLPLNS